MHFANDMWVDDFGFFRWISGVEKDWARLEREHLVECDVLGPFFVDVAADGVVVGRGVGGARGAVIRYVGCFGCCEWIICPMHIGLFKHGCAVMCRGFVLCCAQSVDRWSWFGRSRWSSQVSQVDSFGVRVRVLLPYSGKLAEGELLFFFCHVVGKGFRKGFFDFTDAFLVVGHFKCARIFLGIVGFLRDVRVDEADLGAYAAYVVTDAVAKGFTSRALNFILVFEWGSAAAVAVLVAVGVAFASSTESVDMVWSHWSGDSVFVDLKGVDQVDFCKFRWELVSCCGIRCESTEVGGGNEMVLIVLLGLL